MGGGDDGNGNHVNAVLLGAWSSISPPGCFRSRPGNEELYVYRYMDTRIMCTKLKVHFIGYVMHTSERFLEENEEPEIEGQSSLRKSLLLGSLVWAVASREC